MKSAAQQANGPEANFLQSLSDKFNTASQTGDPSALKPNQQAGEGQQTHGAHHHHHHHGGGAYASSTQDSSSSTDLTSALSGPSSSGSGSTDAVQSVMQQIFAQAQQA